VLGGTIQVASEPGTGLRVLMRLPKDLRENKTA
jgi:chemotaxis protein histidine kinase CheA